MYVWFSKILHHLLTLKEGRNTKPSVLLQNDPKQLKGFIVDFLARNLHPPTITCRVTCAFLVADTYQVDVCYILQRQGKTSVTNLITPDPQTYYVPTSTDLTVERALPVSVSGSSKKKKKSSATSHNHNHNNNNNNNHTHFRSNYKDDRNIKRQCIVIFVAHSNKTLQRHHLLVTCDPGTQHTDLANTKTARNTAMYELRKYDQNSQSSIKVGLLQEIAALNLHFIHINAMMLTGNILEVIPSKVFPHAYHCFLMYVCALPQYDHRVLGSWS